jgi:prepilin-type processing-associated H-X9-DG protein
MGRDSRIVGFTLVETLVVTSIIAVTSAILFPTYAVAKNSAKQTKDLSNIRQIGLAVVMYGADNDDRIPPCKESLLNPGEVTWIGAIQPYTSSRLLMRSPFDDSPAWADLANPRLTSYGLNAYFGAGHPPYFGVTLGQADRPAECVLSMPFNVYLTNSTQPVRGDHFMPMYFGTPARTTNAKFQELQWDAATRLPRMIDVEQSFGKANTLFVDGHAKSTRFGELWVQTPGESPGVDLFEPMRGE